MAEVRNVVQCRDCPRLRCHANGRCFCVAYL